MSNETDPTPDAEGNEEEESLQESDPLLAAELEGDLETQREHLDRDTGGLYGEAEDAEKGFELGAADGEMSPD
jgi:hypothetical protein